MTISMDINSLAFQYGHQTILEDITLHIKPGTFISIIGPNGSGKSTLLKNISSILKPNSGIIKIGEKSLQQMSSKEIAQKIAVVPQETSIEFRFTVMDIVLMGRNPHMKRFQSESLEDYKIVKKAMDLTGTWRLKDRFINELSGGERQRVIIARALAQESEIILLDEPTSYLDIQHQIEILELLERLNRENGLTVVAVLHDINLAARFSSHILLLKDGRIIVEGTPEEVVTLENLKCAYEIDMIINRNPFTGTPYVIPLSKAKTKVMVKETKIHIVCGGGTGGEILQAFYSEGYPLSAGVLNIGDSDWQIGKLCEISMVEELPFTGISEESHRRNLRMIQKSDVVILMSIPIGPGNLKNLEAVDYALEQGKKVIFLEEHDQYTTCDYTKGLGEQFLQKLRTNGIKVCRSINEVLEIIHHGQIR